MHDQSPIPAPRRWLRFSLRTFFVLVTVFACWLGWNLHHVRQRDAVLTRAHKVCNEHAWSVQADVPLVWLLFGAEPVWWIQIPYSVSDEELARVRSLFPEAIHVGDIDRAMPVETDEVHYYVVDASIAKGYLLLPAAIVYFILAAAGIAMLLWLFKDKRRLQPPPLVARYVTPRQDNH